MDRLSVSMRSLDLSAILNDLVQYVDRSPVSRLVVCQGLSPLEQIL